jgi:hypothetical protein
LRLLDLHVGRPVHRGALSIFPIWNGLAVADPGYDLHSDAVRVEERAGAAVVSQLVATNAGSRPALILAGDLLVGGQQHRVAARSELIEAGGSAVLDVRCVEEGRWSGSAASTRSARRAPGSVRAATGQQGVWRTIRRQEQRYGASATHSMLGTLDAMQAQATALVAGLQPLPFQSGVLIGIGGQPLLLEAFDSPAVLGQIWGETLRAAAFDALGAPVRETLGRRARDFVAASTSARLRGAGSAFHGSTDAGPVDVLVWKGRAVHTVATNARHHLVEA